jgi:hypothetical protein
MDSQNNKEICKYYKNCPIFSEELSGKDFTAKAYKSMYCTAGS